MLRRSAAALAALVALLVLAPTAPALDASQLRAKLARQMAKMGPAAGAYVVDLETGAKLYERRADRHLVPASNEKLFVTAAALLRFGPEGTLETSLRIPAGTEIDATGVLHGDLYLVGGGDPSLNDTALRELAAAVADAGITRIAGAVIGDESRFDTRRGSYDSRWKPDWDLGGWLGALVWGHGRAGAHGPAAVAAERLHGFLKAQGIRAGRRAKAGALAAQAPVTLAGVPSPPMQRLAAITNQPSDNFYAEMLVKALGATFGAGGTTRTGLGVVRDTVTKLGVRPRMVDGSGLSRANRTTPRQLVRLIDAMLSTHAGDAFGASLATAGRTGTLRRRMRGTPAAGRCFAKTGTLRGVSALSGFCATTGGRVAFSLLENRVCAVCAKRIEDRMVAAIARYGD